MRRGIYSNLTEHYHRARKDYPQAVLDYFNSISHGLSRFFVLDLGCGTGIATRQLASSQRFIIGCDPSCEMLKFALENRIPNTSYCLGRAEEIPFSDNTFDVITAFSAFHWMVFYDKEKSLQEIKRVLKLGGLLFIVQKRDTGRFTDDAQKIMNRYSTKIHVNPNFIYDPKDILIQSGFKNVVTKYFLATEKFTIEEALQLIQSMDTWNFVDKQKIKQLLTELQSDLNKKLEKAYIRRNLKVTVVSGYNRKV